jgi:broad specificity phosphatase PhoE
MEVLAFIREKSNDGEALIVAHGGIVRTITFLESGEKRGEISNAGLFEFNLDKIMEVNK